MLPCWPRGCALEGVVRGLGDDGQVQKVASRLSREGLPARQRFQFGDRRKPEKRARVGLLAAAALWFAAVASAGCSPARSQPIAFNHRLHADNGVPCSLCHRSAASGQGATLPSASVCRRCHEDVLYESPEEAKIRRAAESGRDLRWLPSYALRSHVYFSHRRHVALGKVTCQACHGQVEMRSEPFPASTSPFAGRRGMTACIRCHEDSHSRFAGVDCVDCHR